ncbi:MAG: M14-type cytosolic carboxypeptidase [Legionellales bacterium]|nr:M14-type cytosolic carboxypeptidase [Legionellales bacterium]
MPSINGTGDSRNIEVVSAEDARDIHLNIRGDLQHPEDLQWFNFEMEGTAGEEYVMHIDNAHAVRFTGWNAHDVSFQTSVSYDEGNTWSYISTTYDESVPEEARKLTMHFTMPEGHTKAQFAFFPPYSYAKHLELIELAKAEAAKEASLWTVTSLGKTKEAPKPKTSWGFRSATAQTEPGRDITMITIGKPGPEKKNIVIAARQHPGEPQAEWYMDGLINRLIASMPEHADLFEHVVLHLVPNMNPDGTFDGNLRTNGKGNDLNRQWQTASIAESPEVYYLLKAMCDMGGVSLFLDIRSDEEIPSGAFLDLGHRNCVTPDDAMQAVEDALLAAFLEHPDTQDTLTYPKDKVRDVSNLAFSNAYMAESFKCPAVFLEMPTKDWTVEKCQSLGADVLRLIRQMLSMLPMPKPVEVVVAPEPVQPQVQGAGGFSFSAMLGRSNASAKGQPAPTSSSAQEGIAVEEVALTTNNTEALVPPLSACCTMS